MHRLWIPVLVVAALASAFYLTRQDAAAIALNESDLPQEADFCNLQFPPAVFVGPGDAVFAFGQVFEAGVTDVGAGANPLVIGEIGYGPLGSDPRDNVDWTWFPVSFNSDQGNNDEYTGGFGAPLTPEDAQYSYTVRFAIDGGSDRTYCDLDGAGSNADLFFDVDQLGLLGVTGTGEPTATPTTGSSEGSVDTSVDVIADPGACIILDTNAVSYGQETFSTQNAAQLGLAQVTITSCSLTTSLDLLAKGTNASGPTANWNLTDPPGSGNMCDTAGGGIDEFSHRVQKNTGDQGTDLALTNRTYMTGLAQETSQPTDLLLRMPCIGSSGTGEIVSSTITFTAIPGAPTPTSNVCAEVIDFLETGLFFPGDNTECTTVEGELLASCTNPPGAGHNDYWFFELQEGEIGSVEVFPTFEAVVALYEFDEGMGFLTEVACGTGLPGELVSVQHANLTGGPRFYIVQVDGLFDGQFGPYDISLNITGGVDADGDGYFVPADCNDADAAINPGAPEIAGDGIDNNCDGFVDQIPQDADADGWTDLEGDCNDNDAAINPSAPEVAGDGIDNNCDGQVDEGAGQDLDLDGFTDLGGDCDDNNPEVFPGAAEVADGLDNDCDGEVDEGVVVFADADNDTFTSDIDCDDFNASIHPGATEIIGDGIDQDCDGVDG